MIVKNCRIELVTQTLGILLTGDKLVELGVEGHLSIVVYHFSDHVGQIGLNAIDSVLDVVIVLLNVPLLRPQVLYVIFVILVYRCFEFLDGRESFRKVLRREVEAVKLKLVLGFKVVLLIGLFDTH